MPEHMASHEATAIGRATPPSLLARLRARHADWLQRRRVQALDTRQRRDMGFAPPAGIGADTRPGWDVRLSGLR